MLYFAIHIFFVTYSNKHSFEVTSVLSLSLSLTLPHRRRVCLSDGWDWSCHTWSLKHSVLLTPVLPWVDLRTHTLFSDKLYAAYADFCLQPHCPLLKTTVENFLYCLNNSTQWFNQVKDAANRHSGNKKQSSLTLLIRHPAFCSCPCISDLGFFSWEYLLFENPLLLHLIVDSSALLSIAIKVNFSFSVLQWLLNF